MSQRDGSRWKRTGFMQRISLLFFIGFFVGTFFYYIFQNSFGGLMNQTTTNMASWSAESSQWYDYLKIIWNHGKYFFLLWAVSVNKKVSGWFQNVFILYTGLRNGFLLLFFVFDRGLKGILLYFASLFPHGMILLPIYLLSFYLINENRQRQYKVGVLILLILAFFAACFVEIKCNFPIMEQLL